MLYDEKGMAYVERPLIPEEQNLFYIVKDYRRMYNGWWKLKDHNRKLAETNSRLSDFNFVLRRKNVEQRDVIRHCLKWMKKNGLQPSSYLNTYVENNRL